MSGPIVIIDRSEILEGKLEDLKEAMNELVQCADANEPRMTAYTVYLDQDGTRVTVLQMHPDSASEEFHMNAAGSAFKKFVEYIRMLRIDIYGRPSPALLERLQPKSSMPGGGSVTVHDLHAGFARMGVPMVPTSVSPPAVVPHPADTRDARPR